MKRNKFSLSHHKLFTGNQGALIPCAAFEVLPGDSIQQSTSCLVRTVPLLAPMMSTVDIRIHHWFVPYRLVWEDFEDFITGGPDGDDASVPPYTVPAGGGTIGSISDYLGVPIGPTNLRRNIFFLRAYGLIWNEWYRDQDLQTPLIVSKASGLDATTNVTLQNVDWEKDYFTSARPWPQKGPDITIPLGTSAPVVADGFWRTHILPGTDHLWQSNNAATSVQINPAAPTTGTHTYTSGLEVDLTGATAVAITELREAFALQRYAEARARYGSRYTEYLRYLGVRSSDARLQRPEYLGGGRQRLQISEVLQTGVTTDGDDSEGVGNLKGHGIGYLRSNRYRRFFEEHGCVLSLFSVKPRTLYSQGLRKEFSRRTREDFHQRELEHVGQMEVLNKEVFADGTAQDELVWGYQDRYDEYRRIENSVAGEFRAGQPLNFWHMGREFSSLPSLGADFVKSNPTDRVYADTSPHELQVVCNHSIQARRMLSKTGSSFIF